MVPASTLISALTGVALPLTKVRNWGQRVPEAGGAIAAVRMSKPAAFSTNTCCPSGIAYPEESLPSRCTPGNTFRNRGLAESGKLAGTSVGLVANCLLQGV